MLFTRIPCGPSCTASARVRFSTPPFAEGYAVALSRPRCPDVDAMFTIRPPRPCSTIRSAAYFVHRNTLFNETPITRSHSASGSSSTFCRSTTPTLFTRMSTPPQWPCPSLPHSPLHARGDPATLPYKAVALATP